jgi:hypothetical protein
VGPAWGFHFLYGSRVPASIGGAWTAEPRVCVLPNNDPFSAAFLRPPLSKLFSP